MKTQPTPGIVGPLITSYLSTNSDRDFSRILTKFSPHIRSIAGTFPKDWNEDYFQEGSIGLFNALKSCPAGLPINELLYYANRAIKSKMIDFYRSTIGRFLVDVDVLLEDGTSIIVKQPCVVQYPEFSYENGDEVNPIENYSPLPDYVSTLDIGIDMQYLLADKQLQKLQLTESEIRVLNLHYSQGYNTSTVSKFLHTSISNASKLIAKANAKVKPYLLTYRSNN